MTLFLFLLSAADFLTDTINFLKILLWPGWDFGYFIINWQSLNIENAPWMVALCVCSSELRKLKTDFFDSGRWSFLEEK